MIINLINFLTYFFVILIKYLIIFVKNLIMITDKQLKEIKTKLALEGVGSKSKLAEKLGVRQSAISLLLNTGYIGKSKKIELLKWLKS